MAQRRSRKTKKTKINVVVTVIMAVILAAYLLMSMSESLNLPFIPTLEEFTGMFAGGDVTVLPDADCEVHFIDVGQGDSMLIRADGQTALIDAGENDQGRIVVEYLQKLGIEKIDLLLMTHPHSDHIGGMDNVIENFSIGKVVMPRLLDEVTPTTKTYTEVLSALASKNLKVTAAKPGLELALGKGTITVLGPVVDYDDLNDTSMINLFTYGEMRFLFTGDQEKAAENDLLDSGANLKADVLKVGHHGSSTSTSKRFYEAVDPDYCVFEVGDDNEYGHPHKETLSTIAGNGAKIYRTDFQGSIVFHLKDGEMSVTVEKGGDGA